MRRILTIIAALLLSSCSLAPDYIRPGVEISTAWRESDSERSVSETELKDWWRRFHNEELNNLTQRALEENNDLAAGVARVNQARAQVTIANASLWPQVNGSAGTNHSQSDPGIASDSLTGGLAVSYEMDIFGANRSAVRRADANLLASKFDLETLRITVTGDLAANFFSALGLRQRLQVADSNIQSLRRVLELVQARYDAGRVSELELAQQKTLYSSALAARALIDQQLKNTEHAIAILIGEVPQKLTLSSSTLDSSLLPMVEAGLPSELLLRRPDLAAAEARLRAADADIGIARAAFFPVVKLSVGWSATNSTLVDPTSTLLTLASSLSAPIFQGGKIVAGLEQTTQRQLELIETYRKAVLVAFREVEDALATVSGSDLREQHLSKAQQEAQRSFDLSSQLYREGRLDFQSVLDSQRTLLTAQDSYVQAKSSQFNSAVALYRALGGGWGGPASSPQEVN